jgi:hypothetical protein
MRRTLLDTREVQHMTRRWCLSVCAVVAVVAASATAVQASAPANHQRPSPFWGSQAHPSVQSGYSELYGVDAVSAGDVWAVGTQAGPRQISTLVEHWDGTSWSVVPSPNPGGGAAESTLNAVDAISANNVWAVGSFRLSGRTHTLVEHWNGTSWRRVPSPNPPGGRYGSLLTSVSAASADNVWAVGYVDPPGADEAHTLAMHWNGGSWSIIRTPFRQGVERGFFGMSAGSSSSAWAVGTTIDPQSGRAKALVEHWNGQRWHQAPIVSPSLSYNVLYGVSVVAPGNAWAVGEFDDDTFQYRTLVEHLSGGSWHQVRPPGLGRAGALSSVSGDGPDDVWMVGWLVSGSVLEHWDGQSWSRFRGPGSDVNFLDAVTTHGTTATWAVGLAFRGGSVVPFEERWNGRVWTR